MKIENPILYCCYNRLDLIKKSIKIIQKINCKKIYISIDGPKENSIDQNKNQEILRYISNCKFNSEIELLRRNKNLGCKVAISSAIDWFFENEESGIILEEDLIPSSSFFLFCDYALNKYKNIKEIMMVSGTNYLGENIISNKYVYSQHYLIWGWATWKRAWQSYDVSMKNWLDENVKNKIKKRYNKLEYKFLNEKFNSFFSNYSDTWDIQWYFSCIENNGLTIMPETNLVTNIGMIGTHSTQYYKTLFLKKNEIDIDKIIPPKKIIRDFKFDEKLHKKYHFKNHYYEKIKAFLKKMLKK